MTIQEKEMLITQITMLLNSLTTDEAPQTEEKNHEKPELLTIKECVQLISGLSEHTLRLLITKGKLPSIRTGEGKRGKILVPKRALLEYFGC